MWDEKVNFTFNFTCARFTFWLSLVTICNRICFPGPREQVNQNTAFIDGSVIYGENPCIVRKLRGFNGRLNATQHPHLTRDLLPRSDSHPECKAPSGFCFIAGEKIGIFISNKYSSPNINFYFQCNAMAVALRNNIDTALGRYYPIWFSYPKFCSDIRRRVEDSQCSLPILYL